jgi:hypothetical protein
MQGDTLPKLPLLYRKMLELIRAGEISGMDKAEFEEQVSRRFRISMSDLPRIMEELKEFGFIKEKTQRKLRFKE